MPHVTAAGPGRDEWSKRAASEGFDILAYVIDCAGSIMAEELTGKTERAVAEFASSNGFATTRRYGPSYWGWDVAERTKLFSIMGPHSSGMHAHRLYSPTAEMMTGSRGRAEEIDSAAAEIPRKAAGAAARPPLTSARLKPRSTHTSDAHDAVIASLYSDITPITFGRY
jgi:hypothetical protein